MSSILTNSQFKKIMKKSLKEVFDFILNNVDEFSIIAYKDGIDFNPKLPQYLELQDDIILFDIANYTLSTFTVDEEFCSFEAGFGEENFATTLQIDLSAIAQILIENEVIFVNLTKYEKQRNAFLSNPNNKKFIR